VKHEIKVNDKLVTYVPADSNEWEIKLYVSTEKDGSVKVNCSCIRTLLENEKDKYTGITIG